MDQRILLLREDIPIWFIYGDRSWIEKHRSLFVQKNRPNSFVSVQIIQDAGHNVFADKPELFNNSVNRIFEHIDDSFSETKWLWYL